MRGLIEIQNDVDEALESGDYGFARELLRDDSGALSNTKRRELYQQIREAEKAAGASS